MTYHLSQRSSLNLTGVHPDLVKVVMRALEISPLDFTIIEGLRTIKRQQELFASGASKTMKSRHIHGFAVDVAPLVAGSIRWDWPLYDRLIKAFKQAAKDVKVKAEFGYDWKTFKDAPHIQLATSVYPDPPRPTQGEETCLKAKKPTSLPPSRSSLPPPPTLSVTPAQSRPRN